MSELTKRAWKIWSPEEIERLCELWPMSKRKDLIHAFAGTHSRMAIYHKARKLGLERSFYYSGRRKYEPRWDFWNNWSANLAYVIGLMAADGYVMSKGGQHGAKLILNAKDSYLLDRICRCAGGKTYVQATTNSYSWVLCGKDVEARLNELGLYTKKTFRVKVPEIPSEFHSHFVRGYFDGDGSIGDVLSPRIKSCGVLLCGNQEFLTDLRELLAKSLPVVASEIRSLNILKVRQAEMHLLITSRRSILRSLLPWLYQDADLCLERKRLRSDNWLKVHDSTSEVLA